MRNLPFPARPPQTAKMLMRVVARVAAVVLLALPVLAPAPADAAVKKHRKATVAHKHAVRKHQPASAKHAKVKTAKPAVKRAPARKKLGAAAAPKAAKVKTARQTIAAVHPRTVAANKPRAAVANWPRAVVRDDAVAAYRPLAVGIPQPLTLAPRLAETAATHEDLAAPPSAKNVCRRGDRIYLLNDCSTTDQPVALAARPADEASRDLQ